MGLVKRQKSTAIPENHELAFTVALPKGKSHKVSLLFIFTYRNYLLRTEAHRKLLVCGINGDRKSSGEGISMGILNLKIEYRSICCRKDFGSAKETLHKSQPRALLG
jgi:hypothetical protein